MEMLISQDWLRRRIETDPDLDVEAGLPIGVLESIGMFLPADLTAQEDAKVVRLTEAFGVLVRQLRRRQQWTIDQLAQKARVDVEDLRASRARPALPAQAAGGPPTRHGIQDAGAATDETLGCDRHP